MCSPLELSQQLFALCQLAKDKSKSAIFDELKSSIMACLPDKDTAYARIQARSPIPNFVDVEFDLFSTFGEHLAELKSGSDRDSILRIEQYASMLLGESVGRWLEIFPQNSAETIEIQESESKDWDHSPDFRCVRWFGREYTFTANQALMVKVLLENWEQETPDVGKETLLNAVDHEAPPERVDTMFRGNEAWNTMIVSGRTKGSYRLTEPDEKH